MRSKIAEKIARETSEEDKIFMRLYADIVVRVNKIMEENELTRQKLASMLGKSPSEVSKWLNNEHNLTLMSIAKLHATLGQKIITIPKAQKTYGLFKQAEGTYDVKVETQKVWKTESFKTWKVVHHGNHSRRKENTENVQCQAA